MAFKDKLAAAKAAPRPFATVSVALDTVVSRKREALSDEYDQIQADLSDAMTRLEEAEKPKPDLRLGKGTGVKAIKTEIADLEARAQAATDAVAALEPEFAESLVDLKFIRVPGDEWAEMTMNNPVRPGVMVDKVIGYNVAAVTRAASLKHGFVIEGDGKTLWQSSVVKAGKAVPFQTDLTGVRQLTLRTEDGGDGAADDWGLWLAPVLSR